MNIKSIQFTNSKSNNKFNFRANLSKDLKNELVKEGADKRRLELLEKGLHYGYPDNLSIEKLQRSKEGVFLFSFKDNNKGNTITSYTPTQFSKNKLDILEGMIDRSETGISWLDKYIHRFMPDYELKSGGLDF